MVFIRIRSGRCFSLESYAVRQAVGSIISYIVLVVVLIYLGVTYGQNYDFEYLKVPLIVLGCAFAIPFLFSCYLLRGVIKRDEKTLRIWVIYGCVETFVITALLISFSIYGFVNNWLGAPIYMIVLAFIYAASMYYVLCVINSLRLTILEESARQPEGNPPSYGRK